MSVSFSVGVGLRLGCIMSPWLLSISMDPCMRQLKARVVNLVVKLKVRGREQCLVAGLFVSDSFRGRK